MTGPGKRPLGMRWVSRGPSDTRGQTALAERPAPSVNTRTALWVKRWPAIALQECVDTVEAAAPENQAQVKWDLPCSECPMNTGCLNAKRKELGSLMYGREILTLPRASEASLFPDTLMDPMKNPDEALVGSYLKPWMEESDWAVVQAWDIAYSEKVGGDWLVCMTALVHRRSGRRKLLDVMRWQRKSFDQQVELIVTWWEKYRADAVVIETDAAQTVWAQRAEKNTPVPVIRHTAREKRDLRAGVPGLLITLENRKWEFPWARGHNHDHLVTFFAELEAFGWEDGKLQGVGEHDDTVMCFYHLEHGISRFLLPNGTNETHRGNVPGSHTTS